MVNGYYILLRALCLTTAYSWSIRRTSTAEGWAGMWKPATTS